jgi:hypothetical protein
MVSGTVRVQAAQARRTCAAPSPAKNRPPPVEGGQLGQHHLESGDDAEVASAAPQRPEQVGFRARGDRPGDGSIAVGGDDVQCGHPVGGESEGATEHGQAAAEGVTDDSDVGAAAARRGPTEAAAASSTARHFTPAPTRSCPDSASRVNSCIRWLVISIPSSSGAGQP